MPESQNPFPQSHPDQVLIIYIHCTFFSGIIIIMMVMGILTHCCYWTSDPTWVPAVIHRLQQDCQQELDADHDHGHHHHDHVHLHDNEGCKYHALKNNDHD